jgi:Protein of unknown function (DUF982)
MTDRLAFTLVVIEASRGGERRSIVSVHDAFAMLLKNWPPESRGVTWRAARRLCLEAIDGHATAAAARNAFIRAAVDAGLSVRTTELK